MDNQVSEDEFFNAEVAFPKPSGVGLAARLLNRAPVQRDTDTCVDLTDSPLPVRKPPVSKQGGDCIVIIDSDDGEDGPDERNSGAGGPELQHDRPLLQGNKRNVAKVQRVSSLFDDSPSPPPPPSFCGIRAANGAGAALSLHTRLSGAETSQRASAGPFDSPLRAAANSPALSEENSPGICRNPNKHACPRPRSVKAAETGQTGSGLDASPPAIEAPKAAPRKRKTEAERQQERDRKAGEREAERQRKAEEREEAKRQKQKEAQARKKEREEAKQHRDAQKEAAVQQKRMEKRMQQKENGKFQLQEITVFLSKEQMLNDDSGLIKKKLQDENISVDIAFDGPSSRLGHRKYISWSRRIWAPDGSQGSQAPDDSGGPQEQVPYILISLTGAEFVNLVVADGIRPLLSETATARPSSTISLLITGLNAHLDTRQRHEIKQFGPTHPMPWRMDAYEALAELHTRFEGVYLRQAQDHEQAAEYIKDLTVAIAKQPYEDQNNFLGTFGGNGAKAKFRSEAKDESIFCQALCHIDGCGLHAAKGISSAYCNLAQLLSAYEAASGSLQEQERLLVGLTGRGGTQRLGPALSKKVFEMFASEDPDKVLG